MDIPYPVKPEDSVGPNAAYRHMKTMLQRAGLPSIRFHDLRHPYVKHTTKNKPLQKQMHKSLRELHLHGLLAPACRSVSSTLPH